MARKYIIRVHWEGLPLGEREFETDMSPHTEFEQEVIAVGETNADPSGVTVDLFEDDGGTVLHSYTFE